jgi:glycosyltransferase involved in cell wall biosynthesis
MVPTLSIVTPSFNQARFIERTLRSVLDQPDVPSLEYAVFDGGSTDGTVDVLRRYEGPRMRFVSQRDAGQADAVNRGIAATTGEVIGWLNSDDVYEAGALARVLRFFAEHPDVEVVYGDANHIDEDDRVLEPYYTEDWDYERLKDVCYLCQPAVFFRRRVVERFGALDARLRYCMDYEYWLRVGASVPFVRVPGFLAGSRLYASNKTLGDRVKVHAEINRMLQARLGQVPERWIWNYAYAVVDAAGADRAHIYRHSGRLLAALSWSFLRWRGRVPLRALRTVWWSIKESRRAARAERSRA